MKPIHVMFGILLCLGLSACRKGQSLTEKQQEIETGKLDESLAYVAEEIGWSTRVPAGWDVMTKETTKKLQEQGLKAMPAILAAVRAS